MREIQEVARRRPLASFVALAYLGSWLLWTPLLLGGLQGRIADLEAGFGLLALGTFGPGLAALVTAGLSQGRAGIAEVLGRLRIWRVGLRWYALALYGGMLIFGAVFLVAASDARGAVLARIAQAFLLLPLVALSVNLLGGPLGEEPGWRGFALPLLLARYSPALGSEPARPAAVVATP